MTKVSGRLAEPESFLPLMKAASHINVESHVPLDERLERIERILSELRDGMAPSLTKRIIRSAAVAFGTVLGVTVLIAIALAIMQPFTRLDVIGDKVDRLIQALEKPTK